MALGLKVKIMVKDQKINQASNLAKTVGASELFDANLAVGNIVMHERFGKGQITNIEGMAVLEPKIDGFRNYSKSEFTIPTEELLVDKAQLFCRLCGLYPRRAIRRKADLKNAGTIAGLLYQFRLRSERESL